MEIRILEYALHLSRPPPLVVEGLFISSHDHLCQHLEKERRKK